MFRGLSGLRGSTGGGNRYMALQRLRRLEIMDFLPLYPFDFVELEPIKITLQEM